MWIYKGLNKRLWMLNKPIQKTCKKICKGSNKGRKPQSHLKKQAFMTCLSVNDRSNKGVNKGAFR
jgi:hypothetical protein